jgi:hypothetical protein
LSLQNYPFSATLPPAAAAKSLVLSCPPWK